MKNLNDLILLTSLGLLFPAISAKSQTLFDKLAVPVDSMVSNKTGLSQGGSVDIIRTERVRKGLVTSSLDALSGQAAGVNVQQNSGDPAAMLSAVRVRGTTSLTGGNDPLVVIDGVYSDLSTLSSIYPADIASFTILKNAAETAPYGSRGASGVIYVTTKKGNGSKFRISYDGNIGFESTYRHLDMMGREEYLSTAKALGLSYLDGGFDTDYNKVVERTGFVQNHHVAFSGGGEKSNYRASLGYMGRNTVIRNSKYNNFIAKIDLHQLAFDDRLTIDFGVFGSSQKNNLIFDTQKLFYSVAAYNPTLPAGQNASGGWDRNAEAEQLTHPKALLDEQDHDHLLNFNAHLQLQAMLNPYLTLKATGSYSYSSAEKAQYLPTYLWAQGQAYRRELKIEDWLANASLNYDRTFGLHHLAAMLMGEYQSRLSRGFHTTVKAFFSNDFGYDNLMAGAVIPYGGTGSGYENPKTSSAIAQVVYDYGGYFSLTGNMRADGSSIFAKGHKWGLFPSLSGVWNVLKTFDPAHQWRQLDKLQLRMGYGLSGNTGGITSYNSIQLLNPNGLLLWKGTPTTTLGLTTNVNPDLKWEKRSTFNIGVDMSMWRGRMVMTAEYYYSKTTDMLYLYDVPVPPFPYNKLLANIGSMSNSGLELGLGITPIQRKDLELNINVNVSMPRNRLLSLSGDYNGTHLTARTITPIGGLAGAGFHGGNNNIIYQIVGQPLGVFYLPHCKGLKKNDAGRNLYDIANLDDDPAINLEDGGDRYIAGQATPKLTLGSNISLRYKDFDISVQMNGAFGHKIFNGTALTYMNMTSFPTYNVLKDAPGQNIADQTATDYWLERGDYLNFDNVTIGWNVPERMLGRYISNLRLSFSVNNLATITGYSGLTPMINSYVVNSTLGIDDKRSYPPTRTFSLGVSIQF